MESIRAINLAGSNALTKPSTSLEKPVSKSRTDGIKMALAKFGLLRGEVMDAIRLESYSKALAEEFRDEGDTLTVLDKLAKSRRGEYESRIPDMGDLLEMVREARTARLQKVREAEELEKLNLYLQDVKDHPENYVTTKELWNEIEARMAAKF
jgi:hypothetical protein